MKTLILPVMKVESSTKELQIVDVYRDAPTWLYPAEFRLPCPICGKTMAKTMEEEPEEKTCVIVLLEDKSARPLHNACFEKIPEKLF